MLSVTDLCSFKFCPRGLYIRRVLKLREPAKPVMITGSIRHQVFDDSNKKEQELVTQITPDMGRPELLSLFGTAYNQILNKSIYSFSAELEAVNLDPNVVTEQLRLPVQEQAHSRADEIFSFATQSGLFGKELWNKLTPKIISELRVQSESLRLKGIVDRIEDHGKEYVPIEIKTGRAPNEGVWPDHRLQVGAYMMLLQDKFGVTVREGLVKYVAVNQTRHVAMNPFVEHDVKQVTDDVFALIEKEELPEYCGKSYCGVCSLGSDYEKHLQPISK